MFVDRRSVIWAKDWAEVLTLLRQFHRNSPRVAVYPDGTAQYLAP
jgi:hypothetical protein